MHRKRHEVARNCRHRPFLLQAVPALLPWPQPSRQQFAGGHLGICAGSYASSSTPHGLPLPHTSPVLGTVQRALMFFAPLIFDSFEATADALIHQLFQSILLHAAIVVASAPSLANPLVVVAWLTVNQCISTHRPAASSGHLHPVGCNAHDTRSHSSWNSPRADGQTLAGSRCKGAQVLHQANRQHPRQQVQHQHMRQRP
jgi:hypothetical protein